MVKISLSTYKIVIAFNDSLSSLISSYHYYNKYLWSFNRLNNGNIIEPHKPSGVLNIVFRS